MSKLYIESRLQAIKDIASSGCEDPKDADNICSFCDDIASVVPDIDKVVEQLEELKEDITKNYRISVYKEFPEIKARYETVIFNLNKAIDIVRKGGKE